MQQRAQIRDSASDVYQRLAEYVCGLSDTVSIHVQRPNLQKGGALEGKLKGLA